MAQTYHPGLLSAYSYGKAQDMLAFALLETVRIVLEEGDIDTDEDKHAPASPVAPEMTSSDHTSSDSYMPAPRSRRVGHAKAASLLGGPCAHCGATESPQWRRPLTKKMVLCNACGIYYSRHHSLPKRKKPLPTKRAAIDEDDTASGEEYNAPDIVVAPVAATVKQLPSRPAGSGSSAERTQRYSVQALVPPARAPAVRASAAAAVSPAVTPSSGSTFVTATRATRKRVAPIPIELPLGLGSAGAKRQATQLMNVAPQLPPAVSLSTALTLSPSVTVEGSGPGVAAAGTKLAATAQASSGEASGVQTGLGCVDQAACAALSSPQGSPRQQQPLAWSTRTASELSADSDSGTILIPVSTCRGPRRVPSRKPSVLSTL